MAKKVKVIEINDFTDRYSAKKEEAIFWETVNDWIYNQLSRHIKRKWHPRHLSLMIKKRIEIVSKSRSLPHSLCSNNMKARIKAFYIRVGILSHSKVIADTEILDKLWKSRLVKEAVNAWRDDKHGK